MPTTRIYVVIAKDKPNRLVEAASAAQAIRHCVSQEYSATVANAKNVAALLKTGTHVEQVTETN